ncbi:MAG TPA: ABC transporter permease [Gemmatimonadaceae bacterium]|nr:ABC transporter permease [Gemmatimonadaceae bacterium]
MAVSAPTVTGHAPDEGSSATVIEPARGWNVPDAGELWRYRELLFFLVWRDLKVRYKQTLLGVGWAVLQPVLTMVVFTLFFGKLAGVPSEGQPYALFSFAGLVPWTFFANGLTQSSNSVVASQNLVSKIYFPRILLPTATVLSGVADLAIAMVVLFMMLVYYGVTPGFAVAWLVPLTMLAFVTALAVGLWLSALNVKYRDVRYVVPFLTQLWLFATPIAYPASLVPEPWRSVYALNPMVGVVEGFRWALLGQRNAPGSVIAVSAVAAFVALIGGVLYFQRTEVVFADVV